MAIAHDEVHVVNVANEDIPCGTQVCWLHING